MGRIKRERVLAPRSVKTLEEGPLVPWVEICDILSRKPL